ncbi:hypothetical protein QE152_g32707 [Popillia japonica]|uniref:Uncharacterized protein n=1 Tax=Popillia japonica TaxID=7064 RepID=A0AAW1IY34_POPJA
MLIEESDGAQENVDNEWKITKECIEQAAEETIGREKIINEKTWFNTECRIKIEEKAKSRLKWLSSNRMEGMEDEEDYKKLRSACNKYLRACKRKWINDNINKIENDRANKNTKSFFHKIKEQKKQYKGVVTGIKEKNGRVVEEESQYKGGLRRFGKDSQRKSKEDEYYMLTAL